jgi:hypothetical protein
MRITDEGRRHDLFNDLIRQQQQRRWNREAERLGCFQADDD